MIDHIGLNVTRLDAAMAFYRAALAPLGYGCCYADAALAGFGPPDAPALWLHAGTRGPSRAVHLALRAPDRAAVDAFHAAALAAGARDHGAPGLRPDYGANYYAAFVIDGDGNNLEAVCLD